ncbi:hypothetical protein AMATHDRAFT_64090 [Amanita thiersii Skay4041]|uniref:Uncharacterized protein n=1 Tax=Amanita thiersii Skay4041 TaxID=703135 RepID=A0A2A9NI32_9AGAR|nr:hypothetical protein AMATHDRAFT_64090 [Amanita thiersii Skay4041]
MPITYNYRTTQHNQQRRESTFSDRDNDEYISPSRNRSVGVATTRTTQEMDDNIVLSELVRTGEQSRLRRRGALRMERVPLDPSRGQPSTSYHVDRHRPSQWDTGSHYYDTGDNGDRDQGRSTDGWVYLLGGNTTTGGSGTQPRARVPPEHDDFTYVLTCNGYIVDETEIDDDIRASSAVRFQPSILPLYPSRPSRSLTQLSSSSQSKQTNGCGAVVHTKAAPRPRSGMWTAKNEATSVVVHLDPCYFDRSMVGKIVRSSCGCVREGIGCSLCGNPLGTRYKPCRTATEGIFSSRGHSSRQHSPTIIPRLPIYSFFATAVSPSPSYTFPLSSSSTNPPFSAHDRVPTPQHSIQSPPIRHPQPQWQLPNFRISGTHTSLADLQSSSSLSPFTTAPGPASGAAAIPIPILFTSTPDTDNSSVSSSSSSSSSSSDGGDNETDRDEEGHDEGYYFDPPSSSGRTEHIRVSASSGTTAGFFFGRYATASPIPLSDLSEDDEDERENEREDGEHGSRWVGGNESEGPDERRVGMVNEDTDGDEDDSEEINDENVPPPLVYSHSGTEAYHPTQRDVNTRTQREQLTGEELDRMGLFDPDGELYVGLGMAMAGEEAVQDKVGEAEDAGGTIFGIPVH